MMSMMKCFTLMVLGMKCFSSACRLSYDVDGEVFLVHLTGCHSYDVDEEMLFVLFSFFISSTKPKTQ